MIPLPVMVYKIGLGFSSLPWSTRKRLGAWAGGSPSTWPKAHFDRSFAKGRVRRQPVPLLEDDHQLSPEPSPARGRGQSHTKGKWALSNGQH